MKLDQTIGLNYFLIFFFNVYFLLNQEGKKEKKVCKEVVWVKRWSTIESAKLTWTLFMNYANANAEKKKKRWWIFFFFWMKHVIHKDSKKG